MLSGIRTKFALSVIFFISGLLFIQRADAAQDRIVAIVNGEAITQGDIEEYLNTLYIQLAAQFDLNTVEEKIKEAQNDALNNLIENLLIIQEAKRQGIEVDDYSIEQELAFVKMRFNSEEEFNEGMKMRGFTLADIKSKIGETVVTKDDEPEYL